jgi:glycosyltransferase involved in cell wall biosynthesis
VIVPVYNERDTLVRSLDRLVTAVPSLELILVDDAATDGSAEIVKALVLPVPVTKCFHATNLGKGAAIRTAIPHARGRYIVMHDADLEYDPQDLPLLMEHLETTHAEAVYGKRFHQQAQPCLWHAWGNRSLSRIFSLVTGTPIADIETCYKMILRERLQDIAPRLRESRFGIEIELTARLVACGTQITELPIRFERRGYPQGKKIGWRDGVSAFRCILRYGPSIRLARRQRRESLLN